MAFPVSHPARWRAPLELGVAGLWDLDPRIELVEYSAAWKARMGFPRIGLPDSTSSWRSRVHPDDYNTMLRSLRLHLDGYTATYDTRFRLRAGHERYITVHSRGRVVARNQRGDALRMVGTMVALSSPPLSVMCSPQPPCPWEPQAAGGDAGAPVLLLDRLDEAVVTQVADLLDLAARHRE